MTDESPWASFRRSLSYVSKDTTTSQELRSSAHSSQTIYDINDDASSCISSRNIGSSADSGIDCFNKAFFDWYRGEGSQTDIGSITSSNQLTQPQVVHCNGIQNISDVLNSVHGGDLNQLRSFQPKSQKSEAGPYQFAGNGILLPPTPRNRADFNVQNNLGNVSSPQVEFDSPLISIGAARAARTAALRELQRIEKKDAARKKKQNKKNKTMEKLLNMTTAMPRANSFPPPALRMLGPSNRMLTIEKDIRKMISDRQLLPGVNILRFRDPQGYLHCASLLPRGGVQADVKGGLVFCRFEQWMKFVCSSRKAPRLMLVNEILRVKYNGYPLGILLYGTQAERRRITASMQRRSISKKNKISNGSRCDAEPRKRRGRKKKDKNATKLNVISPRKGSSKCREKKQRNCTKSSKGDYLTTSCVQKTPKLDKKMKKKFQSLLAKILEN